MHTTTGAHFTRIGFILAAAGSAVGLGNIWKFPYIVGENGGGAFVLVYLATIMLIGFSLLLTEMLIGAKGKGDTVSSFESLDPTPKKRWKYAGFMALNGLVIMSFYSVVIGWIFHNIYTLLFFGLPSDVPTAMAHFTHLMTQQPFTQVLWHTLASLIVISILFKGIKQGIERLNLYLMPALVLIFIVLLFYSMRFESSFLQSLSFMFYPDFSTLTSHSIIQAMGHAFFTLSIGMGALLTYSAALPKSASLAKSAFYITFLDTFIALLASVVIFAFLFHFDAKPSQGPGLVFASMPVIFYELKTMGFVLALLFFLALAFAGLTSAVSLVEPFVEYLINRHKSSRNQAVLLSVASYYVVGLVVIASTTQGISTYLQIGSRSFFDFMQYISDSILLPFSGLVMALFVGYVMPQKRVKAYLKDEMPYAVYVLWLVCIRIVAPLALIFMFLNLTGMVTF